MGAALPPGPHPHAHLEVEAPNVELCRNQAQFLALVHPEEAEVEVNAATVSLLPGHDGHVKYAYHVENLRARGPGSTRRGGGGRVKRGG